jgi:AcrR family transcriptional regulator
MAEADTPATVTSRRERKKLRTREALIDAAFELFERKGFDATTVEEIAEAVDVSSRTFFRYFASKEDVALTFQEELRQAMMTRLAREPAGTPVVTALRHALVDVIREYEDGGGFGPGDRFGCMQELMAASPAILAGSMEHAQRKHMELALAIAARMGADIVDDMRPHLVAGVVMCAFQSLADSWRSSPTKWGGRTLWETADEAFRLLEEGINYPAADA